jgi:hypothetical protein
VTSNKIVYQQHETISFVVLFHYNDLTKCHWTFRETNHVHKWTTDRCDKQLLSIIDKKLLLSSIILK